LIHAVELRTLLRQPFEVNVERGGQRLAYFRGVTFCFIQQNPDGALPVAMAHFTQKGMKVGLPHVVSTHHYAMAGPQIDCAKEHQFSVAPCNLLRPELSLTGAGRETKFNRAVCFSHGPKVSKNYS
jgi:hypothetical protein